MSISLISGPVNYGRVNDSNRLTYIFRSTVFNLIQTNFQFHFKLEVMNMTTGTYSTIGNFTLYPSTLPVASGMTYYRDVEFNMSDILDKYISCELNLSTTSLTELINTIRKFKITVSEFYGTPPIVITSGQYTNTSDPLVLYNGCQEFIPYDNIIFNPLQNKQWVMSGSTSGKFLTDMTEYRLDNEDFAFLYYLSPTTIRPSRIRYTVYYKPSGGLPWELDNFLGVNTKKEYMKQSLPNSNEEVVMDDYQGGNPLTAGLSSVELYDTNVSFQYSNSLGGYFPMGPYQLINYGGLSPYKDTWLYYEVDLLSGATVLNKYKFRVYRKDRCDKYGKFQLFWLNSHGGFDTQVFNAKHTVESTIKKTTYKVKIPLNSTPYEAGEKVFNVDIDENLTLRVDDLTQNESQLVSSLIQSSGPVYLLRKYYYNGAVYPYGLPYIVKNDKDRYEEKVNEKVLYKEVTISPAWKKIKQRS